MNALDTGSWLTERSAPSDQAAVAEAVNDARKNGVAVYPVGGGTMTECGAKPQRPGVGLSLAAMNRLVDYPADDLTITVEAGMTIAELGSRLAAKRQRLPIDVARPDVATVGGAMAINGAGPRQFGYGSMRDYVLGFTAVDGRGTIFSGGGRVVKNAAGYNMCRLMTGSWGTLGVVTRLTLMVRPLPETSVLLVCELSDFDLAEKLLAGLSQSLVRPVAVEMAAGRMSENDLALGPLLAGHVGRLYVGFEGSAAEVDAAVEQLRVQWMAAGATAPTLIPAARTGPIWHSLTQFTADLQINVLPSAVVQTVADILKLDREAAIQSHAGDGVILAKTSRSDAVAISAMRAVATRAGGRLVVRRRADGLSLSAADVWGEPGPEHCILRAIKERFDPQNILNPGRFVF